MQVAWQNMLLTAREETVIIGYTLIILSHFEFLESFSIVNSLQKELCETESLILMTLNSPQKMKNSGVSRSTHF